MKLGIYMYIVDIHGEYQAGISISQIAAEGYQGLIVKASEGLASLWTAPSNFEEWINAGRANNMIVGAYHWLNNSNPIYQLEHFLSRIESVGGPEGLLCCLDVEDPNHPPNLDTLYAFADEFNRRTNHHPLFIYSGEWWWSSRGWRGADFGPLWDSRYVEGVATGSELYSRVPDSWWKPTYGGWSEVTMLQFTSKAVVAGQRIDVSYFNGSPDELRQYTSSNGVNLMGQITGPDPFDGGAGPNAQAAELRDTYYGFMAGYQNTAAGSEGVIARLDRIEEAVNRTNIDLTVAQLTALAGMIAEDLARNLAATLTAEEMTTLVTHAVKRALREGTGETAV